MERQGNLSSGFAWWEEVTLGFLLGEHEAVTWAVPSDGQTGGTGGRWRGNRGATKHLSHTGKQGTGGALPPSNTKPSSLLGSLVVRCTVIEEVPARGPNPFLCLQSTQN